jgi:hypothetical protein
MNVGFYVGLKENARPEIFDMCTEPSAEVKAMFDVVYGPYKSREDAKKYVKAMGELACGEG